MKKLISLTLLALIFIPTLALAARVPIIRPGGGTCYGQFCDDNPRQAYNNYRMDEIIQADDNRRSHRGGY